MLHDELEGGCGEGGRYRRKDEGEGGGGGGGGREVQKEGRGGGVGERQQILDAFTYIVLDMAELASFPLTVFLWTAKMNPLSCKPND